ncbi:hypothetical protein AAG570_006024 [Ranatra chinensis]|uniref:Uncharacterized protein n=1 Tax=Ranatra chinensis TaxID=642074 RepID=A0ABD0XWT7_9HEMI
MPAQKAPPGSSPRCSARRFALLKSRVTFFRTNPGRRGCLRVFCRWPDQARSHVSSQLTSHDVALFSGPPFVSLVPGTLNVPDGHNTFEIPKLNVPGYFQNAGKPRSTPKGDGNDVQTTETPQAAANSIAARPTGSAPIEKKN